MLAKLKCAYVTVGHSERRQYHHEDDALVNAKAKKALSGGVIPIICVGEGLEIRQAGEHVPHCLAQVDGALAGISADDVRTVVIAYEPVWAIGTGEVATPEDAQEVCAAIRARIGELYSAGGRRRGAGALRRIGQIRQCRRPSWRSRTSTVAWSVAPVW